MVFLDILIENKRFDLEILPREGTISSIVRICKNNFVDEIKYILDWSMACIFEKM